MINNSGLAERGDAHESLSCKKFKTPEGNLNLYFGMTESSNNFHAVSN